jgi:hypothetical protein
MCYTAAFSQHTMSRPRYAAPSTRQSLARWLAAWLTLALFAQALAFSAAAMRGSPHRHAPSAAAPKPMLLWRHASETGHAHALAHQSGQAHQHAVDDLSVLPSGADAASDATAQAAAFGMAPAPRHGSAWALAAGRHWMAAASWVASSRAVPPPRRPPRA